MRNLLIIFLVFFTTLSVQAQKKPTEKPQAKKVIGIDSSKVLTIDKTIKTLYNVISGEKGKARNWEQFKYLFHKDAKLIPVGKNQHGKFKTRYLSPDDYVKSSGKWLVQNGFFEKEINRELQVFGNIVHVFSTYEAFNSNEDKEPFMRGINSIQLVNDGKRWWIVNVFWTNETKDSPLPKAYLPKQ